MHECPMLLRSIFTIQTIAKLGKRRHPKKYSDVKSRLILKIYYIEKC